MALSAAGGDESVKSHEFQELEKRLKDAELQLAAAQLSQGPMVAVLENQSKLIKDALDRKAAPAKKGSTIRVEPRVKWSTLGDDNTGGRDVEDFCERFEEIAALSNNG